MDTSINLYVLQSNSYELLTIDIYKDEDKKRYVELNNTKYFLKSLKVKHVRDYVCSIKGVGDSDKNNSKLWKLTVDEERIEKENISTEDDITQLKGKKMRNGTLFREYFQDELDKLDRDEDYEPSSIITIIPATAGPSQAPQAILSYGDIIKILDPFIDEPPNPLRESLSTFNQVPDDCPELATYLKFVDREEEIKQLMRNMKELHFLIKNIKQYTEPRKHIWFSTAVGTPGKGKTTFARRAYENPNIYFEVAGTDVVKAVDECRSSGRNFRIACDAIPDVLFTTSMDHETSFGIILLYEALKYHWKDLPFEQFIEKLGSRPIMLQTILKVILHYIPHDDDEIEFPLFIINIDETNALFESNHHDWLRSALKSLARAISEKHFLFVVLTGTHASDLFELVKSSSAKTIDISLPLLKPEHAEEVLLELAYRGSNKIERISISNHLKYIIELLGVVGRFLEAMIFQMSVIGSAIDNNSVTYGMSFKQSGLQYFLRNCQNDPLCCKNLLTCTKKYINKKYPRYFDNLASETNREIIPFLVAYTLFGWPVERSDLIGSNNKKRKIEELEKDELIFIDNKRLKIPFLTLHEIYSHQNHNSLPSIRILESLDNAISPNQNEMLTISVLTFRLWAIYQKNISSNNPNPCSCRLSQLVPLRQGQRDVTLKFSPTFTVRQTEQQIDKNNWIKFLRDIPTSKCIAYHNMQNAEFADSFLITEPPILIQDKQLITSRMKVIKGHSAIMLTKNLVRDEHNKCGDVGDHFFLFVTDSKKRSDETYEENEIIVTEEESENLFGSLLALRKLYCIEC